MASSNGKTRVLHLIGSSTSDYYYSISVLYAQACMEAASADEKTISEFDFAYAIVHPPTENNQCTWSFPVDLSESAQADAKRYSHVSGIQKFGKMAPDVIVPHMFCLAGLTQFRTLCDLFNFPYLGPNDVAQTISENKGRTKIIFKAAGVPVPEGEVLIKGQKETPTIGVPFVVKPCCEGNSKGISLVSTQDEVDAALRLGF